MERIDKNTDFHISLVQACSSAEIQNELGYIGGVPVVKVRLDLGS